MKKLLLFVGAVLLTASCASISPRGTIESRFIELGLSENRSECLADNLDERLERDDLQNTADFLADLNDSGSAGATLDALLAIDNPRIATAIAAASVSCAFNRN